MSLFAHRLDMTVDVLFFAAGGVYAFVDAALYRFAVFAILFMLYRLWTKALVLRAAQREKHQTLTNLVDAIVPPLTHQDRHQYELSERDRRTIQRSA
jgi:hypothetical protein